MDLGPLHKPFFLMPVVSGANAIHVARPGQEPPMEAAPQEDMRLVDPALVQADGEARRRPAPLAAVPDQRAALPRMCQHPSTTRPPPPPCR
jgi:hypothetical protein